MSEPNPPPGAVYHAASILNTRTREYVVGVRFCIDGEWPEDFTTLTPALARKLAADLEACAAEAEQARSERN